MKKQKTLDLIVRGFLLYIYLIMAIENFTYTVFISSLGDVKEERLVAKNIVDEINHWIGHIFPINLKPFLYEFSVYSDLDINPQNTVNNQLPEIDIFLGIFWTRFGTPTTKFNSGSEEEFYNAFEKKKSEPDKIKMMMFFKEASLPYETDFIQFEMVKAFKEKIRYLGITSSFTDLKQFELLLRIQLPPAISSLYKKFNSVPNILDDFLFDPKTTAATFENENNKEVFAENINICSTQIESSYSLLLDLMQRMNAINERISQMDKLNNSEKLGVFNQILDDYVEGILTFTQKCNLTMEDFDEYFENGVIAFSKALLLNEFSPEEKELEISEMLSMKKGVRIAIENALEFNKILEEIPRVTRELRKSHYELEKTMNNMISHFLFTIKAIDSISYELIETNSANLS